MKTSSLERDARDIFAAALAAVDARAAVSRALSLSGSLMRVGDQIYPLSDIRAVRVVGAGKAAGPMIAAVESILGSLVAGGMGVTVAGACVPTVRVPMLEASHPLPDERSLRAGERALETVRYLAADELLLVVLSGGASALLEALLAGVTLEDVRLLTEALLRGGAPIGDVNKVRRALSRIKAGGLLEAAPRELQAVVLVLSDVLGSPLDVIGSGPMFPKIAPASDALEILARYGLQSAVSAGVRTALESARLHEKRRARMLQLRAEQVAHVVVGDNRSMAQAAQSLARRRGYHTLVLSTFVEGEAREVGTFLAGLAREILRDNRPLKRPACIVASGETTVTVRGDGRGGRNQEMVLSFALHAAGLPGVLLLCAASDGIDGPTDAAGAWANGESVMRAEALGLRAADSLARNDSYDYFRRLGHLVTTGPTGTNTNDLYVMLVAEA